MPPTEMQRLERHVAACAECTHEVALLRGAAAELAWLPPPEHAEELVERISSSLPRRPRRLAVRIAVAVAAVSVALAGFLGTALVREREKNSDLVGVVATAERRVRLVPRGGFAGEGSVYVADGRAAVVFGGMPDPGRGRAYQLWGITRGKPISMSVVTGRGRIERAFTWRGRVDQFAVTIEPAGGSPVPTSDPVLTGA
jgi:anti-sigma-K factor RskA